MITKNDMQLKALIKKQALKYGISPQSTYQYIVLKDY